MTEQDVRLAISIFADATSEGVMDMAKAIEDDAMWERNRRLIAPDVRVHFVNPDSSGLVVMEQDYEGIEGLRQGWRRWLTPWDSYLITVEDVIDAGEGRVVVLVTSTARMRDSGAEVPQAAATTFVAEAGVISEIWFYLDQDQARRDAQLPE
jgi:hypothetical protein